MPDFYLETITILYSKQLQCLCLKFLNTTMSKIFLQVAVSRFVYNGVVRVVGRKRNEIMRMRLQGKKV